MRSVTRKSMPNLEEFAENLWMIDGSPIRNFGIPLPTRMIVMKLTNGPLWVNFSGVDTDKGT